MNYFINKKLATKLLLLFCVAVLIIQCNKEDMDIDKQNQQEIEDYIQENSLNALSTASGLYYVIEEPGSDDKPSLTDQVTVHYEGYLTNGQVFDSSYARNMPSTFPLNGVIEGWQEGIPLFGKNGKGILLIPSKLGYGAFPPPGIPANAVLIFNVEVIDF